MDRKAPVPHSEDMKDQLAGNIARLVARRRQEDADASLGERVAGWITRIAGSMGFILLRTSTCLSTFWPETS